MHNLLALLLQSNLGFYPMMDADKGGGGGSEGDPDGDKDKDKDKDKDGDKDKDKDKDKDGDDKDKDKKFTQKEIDDIIKKEKAKWGRQQDQKKKLEGLSEEDRKAEEQRLKDEELAEREREITLREQAIAAKEILANKGLPSDTEFVALLVDEDAEKTNANIKAFETAWKKALSAAVEEKLKGKTPPGGNKGGAEMSDGEAFAKSRNTGGAAPVPGYWGAPAKS